MTENDDVMSAGLPGQYPGQPTFPEESHEDLHSQHWLHDSSPEQHESQPRHTEESAQKHPLQQQQYDHYQSPHVNAHTGHSQYHNGRYEPTAEMHGLEEGCDSAQSYAGATVHHQDLTENHNPVRAPPANMPLYEARHDPYEGYQHLRSRAKGQPPGPDSVGSHQPQPGPADMGHGHHGEPQSPGRHAYADRRRRNNRYDRQKEDRYYDYDEEEDYDPPRRRKERAPRRSLRSEREGGGPEVQVYAANQPPPAAAPAAPAVNLGETMQMMMMSQMMQQQMQAQQMQAAQMQAMMGRKSDGGGCSRGSECGGRQGSTSVNIQSAGRPRKKLVKSKPAQPVVKKMPVPVAVPVVQATLAPPADDDGATFENWQEAPIILCLMIVGLIYLVSSRASAPPSDDKKTARHLTGASS